ncbi:hypothetical protein QLQ12_26080 [Actinoplanes sp. NEAU-A12]|uniref:EF-hand domain-containing protein n=1 Tax=Actinoplanes sandaracinus TaxID=3045177 RepID=A0ABT6WQS2_9ACTN|nr:hypothetical protein [Actinoplanes sandaracinus]MDI6102091.1 hypothetical protein [Actinoplanes sandaracinus]
MRSLLVVPLLAVLVLAFPAPALAEESVHVTLLALNRSGASGTAVLTSLPNGDLRVRVRSAGLVPNAPHAQHLHGSTDGMDFHCPPAFADTDGDGYVSTEEACRRTATSSCH